MPVKENVLRNKEIYRLHKKDPKKFTLAELGRTYKIARSTATKIFRRYEKLVKVDN